MKIAFIDFSGKFWSKDNRRADVYKSFLKRRNYLGDVIKIPLYSFAGEGQG